ncbi:MAG: hypothetical protein ACM31C_18670 [Acidobacteriota bacterium]
MRVVAILIVCACGAAPKQPFLANAPHPDNAALAGGAAAAAAAMTLADPNAATRGKPEKLKVDEDKQPIEVKEHVPESAFDHLDQKQGSGSAVAPSVKATAPAKTRSTPKGPPPKIPLPSEAARSVNDR